MNSITKTVLSLASVVVGLGMTGGVAFAASNDQVASDAAVSFEKAALASAAHGTCDATCMNTLKHYGDRLTTDRITALANLQARITGAKKLSDAQKAAFSATISTNTASMVALKAKIDADTDVSVLTADIHSIFTDYRIYAIVKPQIGMAAGADAMGVNVTDFATLSAKLQTRIDALVDGSTKSQAQAALNDMNAKVADAKTNADAAFAEIANLAPDHGDVTIKAANKAAVADAHTKMQIRRDDMSHAHADIKTIRTLLGA